MAILNSELAGKAILLNTAANPIARLMLSHGAGAPMDSDFMSAISNKIAQKGIEVIRFEFEYMAKRRTSGSKRPPPLIKNTCTEWDTWLKKMDLGLPQLPLFIGGKSMGGRIASMLNSNQQVMPSWHGVICLGYPFHPQKQPEKLRITHLLTTTTPTLIVQGTKDNFGSIGEVAKYPAFPKTVTVQWIESANHDLKPLKRSGTSDEQALDITCEYITAFIKKAIPRAK